MMDGAGEEVGDLRIQDQDQDQSRSLAAPEQKCPALCDVLHGSIQDRENSPMMRATLCGQVCKLYRFQTEDGRWLLVLEQMSETPLCFSLPKQLLSALSEEHTNRILDLNELGELPPHWAGLRQDVVQHCNQLIALYQETLTEIDKLSASSCFKSSLAKSDRHLQFVPTNLHSQRMEVTSPGSSGVWYDVITFGAPADHHQGFKHGGLRKLLSKRSHYSDGSASFSQEEGSRARRLLARVAQLQPLIFGLAEELLTASLQPNGARLQQVLDGLTLQIQQFVHALKDELVRSALVALHRRGPDQEHDHEHANGLFCQRDPDYDGEDWDRAWVNVAKSLDCILHMAERLQGREPEEPEESTGTTASPCSPSSWQEQLLPLVVTLRDCVREAVTKARAAMTYVVLQGALSATLNQGTPALVQRRHAVFSQALAALVCGFVLRLRGGLEDPDFLQQLLSVGVLAQFESLLSTYGEELGMLEDMAVGVSDLGGVAFSLAEARTDRPADLLPTLSGSWGRMVVTVPLAPEDFKALPRKLRDGGLIRVEPVLFNIGINQHQSLAERFGDSSLQENLNLQSCERLRAYCQALSAPPHADGVQALPDLLASLQRSVETKKRKNVEVLWIAALVCRTVGGVRLTSCKSAKDRTAMSVTLEQSAVLREKHNLKHNHFHTALDCMRRDGCRMENVQKNVGCRRFAFSSVQLLTFPKLYRPPDGSYG
ncbi:type II inositol 3,4-bisphosphate 4-phosphatase-like isoform 2-T2 [Menidia menidia]